MTQLPGRVDTDTNETDKQRKPTHRNRQTDREGDRQGDRLKADLLSEGLDGSDKHTSGVWCCREHA